MGDILTGNAASITLPSGINMSGTDWSATLDVESVEVKPAFGENWKGHAPTVASFAGSVKGRMNDSSSAPFPIPTAGATWDSVTGVATFTAATGNSVSGTFVFSKFALEVPRSGAMPTISVDFVNANTDVTRSWA